MNHCACRSVQLCGLSLCGPLACIHKCLVKTVRVTNFELAVCLSADDRQNESKQPCLQRSRDRMLLMTTALRSVGYMLYKNRAAAAVVLVYKTTYSSSPCAPSQIIITSATNHTNNRDQKSPIIVADHRCSNVM